MRTIAALPFYLAGAMLTFYAVIVALKAILDTIAGGSMLGSFLVIGAMILGVLGTGSWKLARRIHPSLTDNAAFAMARSAWTFLTKEETTP